MKKTLIAAGIAAAMAAPSAFAELTIGGQVKVTYASIENSADVIDYDNAISFKASEDMGNGMSTFAELTMDLDNSEDAATASANKDVKVGVKGSFGTVVVGRMETFTEAVVSSMFDDGKASHAADTQLEASGTVIGRANAFAYVSPTVNGFHVGIAAVDAADDGGFADHSKDYVLVYENGPFTIKAAMNDNETANSDRTAVGASYSMGDAKISVGYFDTEKTAAGTTNDLTEKTIRLDYKLGGGNSLLLGYRDSDEGVADVVSAKLTHSLSKKSAIWVGGRMRSDVGSGNTDSDVIHAGMIHKF
jgi:hypothetical protein